mmetsp:Transcript_29448/g.53449  ORF Transcript_29448/g.53449 Transcript_29448/m.53449 type:complete len:210 (+) Transcript_29448:429-1058(+)
MRFRRLAMPDTETCMVFMSKPVGGPFTFWMPRVKDVKLMEPSPSASSSSKSTPGSSRGISMRFKVSLTELTFRMSTNSSSSTVPLPSTSASSKTTFSVSSSALICFCMRFSCSSWFCFAALSVFSTMTPTMMLRMPKVVRKRKQRMTRKKRGCTAMRGLPMAMLQDSSVITWKSVYIVHGTLLNMMLHSAHSTYSMSQLIVERSKTAKM